MVANTHVIGRTTSDASSRTERDGTEQTKRRDNASVWRWLIPVLVGPAITGVFGLIAWMVFSEHLARPPQRIEYVIPLGAAARVAAGEAIPSIPASAVFLVGDVLVVNNQDQADHQLGPFWIPSGTAIAIPFERPSAINYLCTIHPSGSVAFQVRSRDSLERIALPTLLFGLPLGGVLGLITRALARLDTK